MGGEFVITWGGFLAILLVFTLLGLLVGWMGGKAERRDKQRAEQLQGPASCVQDGQALCRRCHYVFSNRWRSCPDCGAANPSHSQGTEK